MQSEYENRYQPQLHPHPKQLACPRCDSIDTKFCYYNNYNLSQPRHYCKSCKRYWTHGGSLRNVPVGGSKRSPPSESAPHEDMSKTGPVSDDKSYSTDLNLNETPVYDTCQGQAGGYYVG